MFATDQQFIDIRRRACTVGLTVANYILAVCFDFGDTLIDEATEVKDDTLTTLRAELIPGAQGIELPGRDHNRAVGDKGFKQAVLGFFARQR